MTRFIPALSTLLAAAPALAAGFERPTPNAQSATAEFWFAMASLAFVAALIAVARLVARR
ncbi:hypothetical protein PSA7680_00845 [Pseudoruegeria aquimaris]|uniref:Protein NnrT n=1 Tax=Pseudoruegeria aquimaris TaxID=393663 RepID=A0A1Y5RSU3_9RHOB|nr:protein NnrT [Pseudoruegeria aquimaris]SLN21942.1 hypothetical protein PSA7680_00845 [Pseudoruegeria aquimaris]